ncbi:MAG: sel1 repeat family protein [Firmicutes bacterium]|nr:sel1 repeat family protein [Bacillota bacterium]
MIKTISYSGGKYGIYNEEELKPELDRAEKFCDMLWYDEAFEVYYRLAQKHYPPALYKLGCAYYLGDGVDECDSAAFDMFKRASELGYVPAHRMLGRCYCEGIGTDKKPRKAYSAFLKGAKAGDLDAMFGVWRCCDFGIGRKDDFAAAIPWIQKLADAGEGYAIPHLARAYFFGLRGLNRDRDRAIELYEKAAEQNNSEAITKLKELFNEEYKLQ